MGRCPQCEGRGYKYKHKNCHHGAHEAYIRGCYDTHVCHDCLGTGYTGARLIQAALLEIKLESNDIKARALAEKALAEFTN